MVLVKVNEDNQQAKSKLRRTLLNARQSLSQEEWREKSDRLCFHLQSSALFTQAETILAYFSFRQEPDLTSLITQDRLWGFPRCVGKSLTWHRWQPGDRIQKGQYGILEPYPDAPLIQPKEVNLILVPSVACDGRGYRLGYGGGYYDRMLNSESWQSKPTIGILFDFALVLELSIDSWDQPLKGICTERGLKIIEENSDFS